jgi:hypothetical protein
VLINPTFTVCASDIAQDSAIAAMNAGAWKSIRMTVPPP